MDRVDFCGTSLALVREEQVRAALGVAEALADLRAAFGRRHAGKAVNRPRVRVTSRQSGTAWLHTLRADLPGWGVAGGKDYTSIGFETPAMWATVVDTGTGLPIALIEAAHLSNVRTAAVTALATDLLAPPDPRCLVHFGAGKISELLVRGVLLVRPSIEKVLLVRRDASKGDPDWAASLGGQVDYSLVESFEALSQADLATTATSSKDPVIPAGAAIPRLRHLNLVGANHLKRQEIAEDLARRCVASNALLVADDPEQAALEAGDFASLVESGELRWEAVRSLPSLVADPVPRPETTELTAFKSVGIGLMDLVVAAGLLRRLGLLDDHDT